MRFTTLWIVSLAALAGQDVRAGNPPAPSPSTQFVAVEKDVNLEVVDWGGAGRPLILLGGLGATAHAFDQFAPKLTGRCHVYGITRRGFGASSAPASGYSSDRLGDDVLAVMDTLKITKPVLVGHSMAGEELSSVGSRFPEKVAGLVYLEAAYSYAFYDPSRGDLTIDSKELRDKIDRLLRRDDPDPRPLIADLLKSVPQFEKELQDVQTQMPGMPGPQREAPALPAAPTPSQLIFAGWQKYTSIKAPVLVIFAEPHAFAGLYVNDPAGRAKAEADDVVNGEAQANVIGSEAPSSRVVRMAHATHMIYQSRESDVLREMDAFLDGLPGL